MSEHYINDSSFGMADQVQVWVGHVADCMEPDPGKPEVGQTYTRLEPGRPKQQQQQQQRRKQQQAAAASRSRVARHATRCKPGWSRPYIVAQADPSRTERNTLQICTKQDLQRWAGPEQTDLASKLRNANPHPPQRTGVATAEDKTGPQTLCGVAITGRNKPLFRVFLARVLPGSKSPAP
jgi:hypothetical protein